MTSRFPTAAEFASWPPPNYVDPDTRQPLAMALIIPTTVLVIAFISGRFYSRTVLTYTLCWDDFIMLFAAILSVSSNIMVIISMTPVYQMGFHLWDIRPEVLYGTMKASQMGMAFQLLFTAIVTLMKVAILLTYLRIFPSRLNKWFCYIMIAYTVALNTACFFLTLFQCSPASTYWEIFKHLDSAKCLNIHAIYYFHSAQNTISDFLIFLWPSKELLTLQVPIRQRVTLVCMFSLGIIVCIAGVMRTYYVHLYLQSYDVFWYGGGSFIIMSVEGSVGIICGCLPGCKPLMNKLLPRIFPSPPGPPSYPTSFMRHQSTQLGASRQTHQSRSRDPGAYHLQSLGPHSEDQDTIMTEKQRNAMLTAAIPRTPIQPKGVLKGSKDAFDRERWAPDSRDDFSDASSEVVILQRGSANGQKWYRSMP